MDGYYGEKLFRLERLMPSLLRLKSINNNSQEASCSELGNCHAMQPCNVQGEQCNEFNGDYDEIQNVVGENPLAETRNMATDQYREIARANDDSSSSNSTGNLSISQSDYCDEDDEIFLGNQQFAEDEISEQSDDCVYAYRGADFDPIGYRNNNNIDDETDFLEMDFEPDPASEIDNTTNEGRAGGHNCNVGVPTNEIIVPAMQMFDEASNPQNIRSNFNLNHLPKITVAEDFEDPEFNHNNISTDGNEADQVTSNMKFTGTKPKKQSMDRSPVVKSLQRVEQQADTKGKVNIPKSPIYANREKRSSDIDDPCIDCSEKEFLSTTIGRKIETTYCRKCRRRTTINSDTEIRLPDTNRFGFDFTLDDARGAHMSNVLDKSYSNEESCSASQNVENLLKRTGKESVTFSSVDVDEKVIIQALDHINVSFKKDIIKKHFECLNSFQPRYDNVTQLILHTSKRNCDYKKVIKLIRLACNDEVDIQFTRDDNVSKETEIVQVRSCDILEMWTIQHQNLERLKKLNKKFIQMNVLGKVINLIRHAQQRNTKSIEEFIIVPQYYKTGYICITKK